MQCVQTFGPDASSVGLVVFSKLSLTHQSNLEKCVILYVNEDSKFKYSN